jgi:hypothetical protein
VAGRYAGRHGRRGTPGWRLYDTADRLVATACATRDRGRHPGGALVVRDPGTTVIASVWRDATGERGGLRLRAERDSALHALLFALL